MTYFGSHKYVAQHWKKLARWSAKSFISWSLMLFTINGSFIAFLPPEDSARLKSHIHYLWFHPWLLVLLILLIACLAVLYNWPLTRAEYKDKNTDIRVIIECCDILAQHGLKVIHVVDTFDAELGRIITPRSLHGAFLRMCQQEHFDVDAAIDGALEGVKPAATIKSLPGRKVRYALGTLCPVNLNEEHFCMAAFTHLQTNGSIAITKDEYIACLKQLWHNLANPRIREEVVNVAVMGNRFVDLPAEFSTEQKIDLMIQTFFAAAREKACCRTLRICIHPDNVTDIDFGNYPVIIEHLAKRPII
ncbi:MAG: hypothetical protein II901_02290 [Paludibacteraceae bacterium]|nr:hypothetical protein [Paludibacteraceae bacterium]